MTDEVIENISEEVLATEQKKLFGEGKSHLDWLFHFTRALGAPDDVIKLATPNADAVLSESLLYNFAHQRPWYEMIFGALMAIESQIPEAYKKVVAGFEEHYTDVLDPDDYKFHTVHIIVDEDHGGGMDELAEKYLDTDEKRRSARAAYFAGAESARRCWDAFDGVKW
jgi:pyrroloquinoline quinone (PQQ) biosynthesis protein C